MIINYSVILVEKLGLKGNSQYLGSGNTITSQLRIKISPIHIFLTPGPSREVVAMTARLDRSPKIWAAVVANPFPVLRQPLVQAFVVSMSGMNLR